MIPRPMTDPCIHCEKQNTCISADTYKCPTFHTVFVRSWDETVAFLKQQLLYKKED